MTAYRKKLIEVALPLDDINRESAREKSIRHGHPSTLHLWWARRPLAACRAVLFASLVDDPSAHPDRFPTEQAQQAERERLFAIIRELVKWDNVSGGKDATDPRIVETARAEILRHTDGNPPPVLDPFCGGGSIPLEAQRLGLEAHASDLNPVAVLITKALIEIPPRFANRPPIHPVAGQQRMARAWQGAQGLAEDVRYYGAWMRERALQRIGHLYPKVTLPAEHGGGEATVIAWLWARTVTCPNPACGARMPLARSFALSTKRGKETWVEPVVDHAARTVRFTIRIGVGTPPEGTVGRQGARCIVCGTPVPLDHVRAEGRAGRMSAQMMAIVAEGRGGRIYLPPTEEHEAVAANAEPEWAPETNLPEQALGFRVQLYGMTRHRDLFTPRQLVALTTFSDLVGEAREQALRDAVTAGLPDDGEGLDADGRGARAYADAVATYLGLGSSRCADFWSTIATWSSQAKNELVVPTFRRQAIPMTWDYGETNPFSESSGNFLGNITVNSKVVEYFPATYRSNAQQHDAAMARSNNASSVVSTDPPYYDNIGYADLSDFFYVWLRRSLYPIYPHLFSTMLVPKVHELVADPMRFAGSKALAEEFFEEGLGCAFIAMRTAQRPDYPLTVFYAFKQSESEDAEDEHSDGPAGVASTGWEMMLTGLINAGFTIAGTWPMRSKRSARTRSIGSNALASSIVLVCRPRPADAPVAGRRQFVQALSRELPEALRHLQQGNIAPVDLAQSAIGPGMAVFSRYAQVLEADGSPMRVRTALALINQALDQVLAEQEGEFDADTRWALAWFEQFAFAAGAYGVAETLSKAKNTSVEGLREAGILHASAGKVRLLGRDELPADWDPATDRRLTVWEATQHLIRAHDTLGEGGAAALLRKVGALGETARDLAYRLYTTCERKGWSQEAQAYNALVVAWPEIARLAARADGPAQLGLTAPLP